MEKTASFFTQEKKWMLKSLLEIMFFKTKQSLL